MHQPIPIVTKYKTNHNKIIIDESHPTTTPTTASFNHNSNINDESNNIDDKLNIITYSPIWHIAHGIFGMTDGACGGNNILSGVGGIIGGNNYHLFSSFVFGSNYRSKIFCCCVSFLYSYFFNS